MTKMDDETIHDLLRQEGLREEVGEPSPDLLEAVQARLREESGGEHFSDAWSRAVNPNRQFFWPTLLIVLALCALWASLPRVRVTGRAVPNATEEGPVTPPGTP